MTKHVRGSLFSDYVRMIRRRKDVAWERHLTPEDMAYLLRHVDLEQWYPMETFERMGNAILTEIADGNLEMVRLWGRLSAEPLHELHPHLVAKGDPVESLRRFKVLRSTFFERLARINAVAPPSLNPRPERAPTLPKNPYANYGS